MKKTFNILTLLSATAFFISLIIYRLNPSDIFLSLTITAGTVAYHFLMRLTVGVIVNAIFHNKFNYDQFWFRPKVFEKRLYASLKIRRWRTYIPTYSPDSFSSDHHTYNEIAGATCQAEIVHEIIILLSFAPILLAIPFGEAAVFIITSTLSALFDTQFVILQRYNRPIIVKLIKRDINRSI